MKFTYPSGSRPLEGYTIKRGIGQGGFGEVYYATSDAGKEVALKLIRRNLDVELRGVTQCLNLKHPNLLSLYDIKVDELGDSWVIMEYVAGESLEDVLIRHPEGLPQDEAMLWFHGIAAGVAYLHDRGIVHRDLKPGNIFNDDGLVKIGDYGLSKFISASRRSGQTESVGTVHYMAPEIANGRYGKEIDIYALGVLLFELLTGNVPFDGESVGEVLMKHLTAEPDVDRVPEPYRAIVAQSLAKDPAHRVHTVAELLSALPGSAAGAGLAVASLPPSPRRPDPALAETTFLEGPPAPPAPPLPLAGAAAQAAVTSDEEPILRALGEAWTQIRDGWQRANFNLPTKIALWVAGVWLLIHYVAFVVPAVIFGGICYAGYRLVRWMVVPPHAASAGMHRAPQRPASPRPPPAAEAHVAVVAEVATAAENSTSEVRRAAVQAASYGMVNPPRRGARSRHAVRRGLPAKSPREKVTDLFGSMLLAAAVSAAAAVLSMLVQRETQTAEYVWLALAGTAGAWGLLVAGKFWEGRHGDAVLRRFVLLGIGLAFGLFAWEAGRYLDVVLTNSVEMPHVAIDPKATHNVEGQPEMLGYLAYFGFLFLIVRWWRQSDPLRTSRLSLWSVLVCVFWAGVLNAFWAFPQPWGMMVAATVSVAVQLASPWVDPQQLSARAPAAPAAAS